MNTLENIITSDGFSWTKVNEIAKKYWKRGIELYVVYDDESESLIESLKDLEDHLSHNRNVCVETALAKIPTNIVEFIAQAKTEGGGSYRMSNGDYNPTTGYMVSIRGCEEKFDSFPTARQIAQYITKHGRNLTWDYLGIWYNSDDNVWYMDVSRNIQSLSMATIEGKKNKQIAIWDCAKGKEIKLADDEAPTYARTCSVTGEGMNEGWYYEADQMYFKNEADALAYVVSKGYDDLNDAYEHDECYYTEWDVNED